MNSYSILRESVVTKLYIKFSATTETLVLSMMYQVFQKLNLTNSPLISWKTKYTCI